LPISISPVISALSKPESSPNNEPYRRERKPDAASAAAIAESQPRLTQVTD
jgi:hypothetical protein